MFVRYREKTLFVDMKTNSRAIMSAKTAVGHAVANQWFGNLVTPAQWDFAWLNKGLATYFEYFATAMVILMWYNNTGGLYDTTSYWHCLDRTLFMCITPYS